MPNRPSNRPPDGPGDGLSRRSFLGLLGRVSVLLASAPTALALPAIADGASGSPASPISHGSRQVRAIALTIDDGWGPSACRRMFEIAEANGVAATFFPYAQAMHLDPRLWRQISDAGYPLANHTNSHPFMTRLSTRKQHFELTNARHVAEQITGRAQFSVFRPPYGDWNRTTLEVAHDAGYPTVVLWDTTDLDTTSVRSPSLMLQAASRGTNGSILLTHGGPPLTPMILPSIIAFYRSRGFRFVTIPELLGLHAATPAGQDGPADGADPGAPDIDEHVRTPAGRTGRSVSF